MSDSPLISQEVRDYMNQFSIEDTITEAVNQVLRQRPPDAYSFLGGYFSQLSTEAPSLVKFQAHQFLTETGPMIMVQACCSNKGLEYPGPSFVFSADESDQSLFDNEDEGLDQAIQAINRIDGQGITITEQRSIDQNLSQLRYTNIIIPASFAACKAAAYFAQRPLYQYIGQMTQKREWSLNKLPLPMIPVLYGGKALQSKVKFSKFLVYPVQDMPSEEYYFKVKSYVDGVRKIIATGKGGENAVKQQMSGGFLAPGDTIADCLKILEDAGNQTGLKLGQDFMVAIECNYDDYYLHDQNKYEIEGAKQPLDANQTAEYFAKLVHDKPFIGMIEDPMALNDLTHLQEKIGERVEICMKKQFQGNPSELQRYLEAPSEQQEEEQEAVFRPNVVTFPQNLPVSQLVELKKLCKRFNLKLILTESSNESWDDFLVDLAVGLEADYLIMGPPYKNSRLMKFNRLTNFQKMQKGARLKSDCVLFKRLNDKVNSQAKIYRCKNRSLNQSRSDSKQIKRAPLIKKLKLDQTESELVNNQLQISKNVMNNIKVKCQNNGNIQQCFQIYAQAFDQIVQQTTPLTGALKLIKNGYDDFLKYQSDVISNYDYQVNSLTHQNNSLQDLIRQLQEKITKQALQIDKVIQQSNDINKLVQNKDNQPILNENKQLMQAVNGLNTVINTYQQRDQLFQQLFGQLQEDNIDIEAKYSQLLKGQPQNNISIPKPVYSQAITKKKIHCKTKLSALIALQSQI